MCLINGNLAELFLHTTSLDSMTLRTINWATLLS